jgi:uncharacterized RDD family membrane protein YckC
VSDLPAYPEAAAEREAAEGPRELQPRTYASWGRRAVALIVDNLLLFVPVAAFFALAFVPNDVIAGIALLLAVLFWFVFPFVYFTVLHGRLGGGQTIGKRALGIRVQDADTGEPIGYGASFGRYALVFVFGLFAVPVLLDYLFPLWDKQKQSLHDKAASSVVVRA